MIGEPQAKVRRSGQTITARQYAVAVPCLFIGGLFAYKWRSSFMAIQAVWFSGALSTRSDVIAFDRSAAFTAAERTLNYFAVIWPALAFGIVIGAAVRVFVPAERLARIFSGGFRGNLSAGAAGAPLMLCSCCVAPVFTAMYERTSRLGPSVALMLASPSLNPAALILTFMLFAPEIAAARLLLALSAVFLGSVIVERFVSGRLPAPLHAGLKDDAVPRGLREAASAFSRSLLDMAARTVPALALGVVCSMLLVQFVSQELLASSNFHVVAVVATASIAVPLALPTFLEIPLALGLLAAGVPVGAAVALLFAGPAINLPSLFALARSTNWRIAAGLAAFVWAVAVVGGLLMG